MKLIPTGGMSLPMDYLSLRDGMEGKLKSGLALQKVWEKVYNLCEISLKWKVEYIRNLYITCPDLL